MQRRFTPVFPLLLLFVLIAVSACCGDDANKKEIGTIAVDDYSPCEYLTDLLASDFCEGLVDGLESLGGWTESAPFPIRDINATSGQIDWTGTGQNLGDTVDFFVFAGHSWPASFDYPPGPPWDCDYGAAYHLTSQHDHPGNPNPYCECNDRDCGNINHKECRWGNDDNEVVLAYTCQFLKNLNNQNLFNQIKYMHNRNHIILGFASNAPFNVDPDAQYYFGDCFAVQLMGLPGPLEKTPKPIIDAWFEACEEELEYGTHARAHYWHGDCDEDFLTGNWLDLGFGGQPPACTYSNRGQFAYKDHVVGQS